MQKMAEKEFSLEKNEIRPEKSYRIIMKLVRGSYE